MPTERELATGLRQCVWELRQRHRTKRFPTVVHVGRPGAAVTSWAVEVPAERLDRGLCHEIAAALVSRALAGGETPAGCWLTRPGVPVMGDADLLWLEPMRSALEEAGLVPELVAMVTRFGWFDPYAGRGVSWKRLRMR